MNNFPQISMVFLYQALEFLKGFDANLSVLFLNTNENLNTIVKKTAIACQQHYIIHKYIGGTFTNWKRVSKSIRAFFKFKKKWKKIEGKTLPKLFKMENRFSGYAIDSFLKVKKPNVLVVIDSESHAFAIQEAKLQNIPIIALGFIPDIRFPIPGNNENHFFVHFCLNWICTIIRKKSENKEGTKVGKKKRRNNAGTTKTTLEQRKQRLSNENNA